MPKRKSELEQEESIHTQLSGIIIQEETTIVLFDVLISGGAFRTVFEFENLFKSRCDGLFYYLFDMKNIVMRDSVVLREILDGMNDNAIRFRGKRYAINWID